MMSQSAAKRNSKGTAPSAAGAILIVPVRFCGWYTLTLSDSSVRDRTKPTIDVPFAPSTILWMRQRRRPAEQ
jgi:hypothetical protein